MWLGIIRFIGPLRGNFKIIWGWGSTVRRNWMCKNDVILVHSPIWFGLYNLNHKLKFISLNYLSPLWSLASLSTTLYTDCITCPTCTCTSLFRLCKSLNPLERIYWLFTAVKFTWIFLDRVYTWLATWTHRSLPKCEHRWAQS